jgi:hypothetical protein
MRLTRTLLVAGAAILLAGCGGGSSSVDSSGYSASDRRAANEVLGILARTAVWQAAAQATYTNGSVPAACSLHIVSKDPRKFKLFITWIPAEGLNRRYAYLEAVIGPEGLREDYQFRLRYTKTQQELESHYGDAFQKPNRSCLVLENGKFALLPAGA